MCGIGRAIFGTQGDGSLVIMEAKKRGEIHLAFAMYKNRPKTPVLTPLCSMGQISENPSVYAVFSTFVLLYHIPLFFSLFLLRCPKVVAGLERLQLLTAALPYAHFITHRVRSRRHLLLSYIRTSPICKIIDFEWVPENLATLRV